jgi:hypothetical protein
MNKKIVYAGCSFTAGTGFDETDLGRDCKEFPDLWVNLCSENIKLFKNLVPVNVAYAGASNSDIFEQVIKAFGDYSNIEYVICAWTSIPRINKIHVGFELYDTTAFWNKELTNRTHYLNGHTLTDSYIQNCLNRYVTLLHIHYEIVDLLRYVNMIKNIAKDIKIININGLCPWDNDFFVRKVDNFYPSDLSKFTQKEILNCKNRDDEEIYKLYTLQHDNYDATGGVDPDSWVNLYDSFLKLKLDLNFDNSHPGIKSNQLYYNLVKQYVETNF